MKGLIEVFTVFIKIGVFGFGGGYATIPLIQKEVEEKKRNREQKTRKTVSHKYTLVLEINERNTEKRCTRRGWRGKEAKRREREREKTESQVE